jgi:hypothetical protein
VHVAPSMHLPPLHVLPSAQSVSIAQIVLHAVAPHEYAPHATAGGVLQLPLPSHTPTSVPIPSVQLAASHVIVAPAYPSHAVAVMPSHSAASHGLSALPIAHAAREPTGLPTTGVHVPAVPNTLHASHCPLQSELQQTPSAQRPSSH